MRKTMQIVLALVAAFCFSTAQAAYDARLKELKTTLEMFKDAPAYSVVETAITNYFVARNACLTDLIAVAGNTSQDKQDGNWKDRVSKLSTVLAMTVDVVKGSKLAESTLGSAFAGSFSAEEGKFVTGLEALSSVAARRDFIVVNQKNVSEKSKELDEKWRYIFDTDNAIDQHEKVVVDEIERVIDQLYVQADANRRTAKEKVLAGVGGLTAAAAKMDKPIELLTYGLVASRLLTPEQAQVINDMIRVLKEMDAPTSAFVSIFLQTNRDYLSRKYEFDADLRSERGGVFVIFGSLRRDTEDFVTKNDFSLAQKEYDSASNALDAWKGSLFTSGQKSDAGELAPLVLAQLKGHLSNTEKTFNSFVSSHKSKFFGPIGPDIRESLLEKSAWESNYRRIEGKGVASRLAQWRDEANTFYSVSLSGLTSGDQEEIRKFLRDRVADLVKNSDETARRLEKFRSEFDRSALDNDLR